MHVIGDAAVREALNAVAAARDANSQSGRRRQVAHLQIVDPADIPRIAQLGVVANFSPTGSSNTVGDPEAAPGRPLR